MLLTALLACTASAVPAGEEADVLAYDIQATLESDHLVGTVTMRVKATEPVTRLELQFASSMRLLSCRFGEREVPFERSGWDLTLDLEAAGPPRGEFELVFEVEGRPYNKQSNGLLRTVVSEEYAYARNQYAWYPRRADDLALATVQFTARADWSVRTAGTLRAVTESGGRKTWSYSLASPCRSFGFAAGPYVIVEGETAAEGGVAPEAWVFEGHEPGARILLAGADRAIKLYRALFGSPREHGFSLVEMPAAFGASSGYGEVGYALIGSGAFEAAGQAPWSEALVAHEVAHTWWGREVVFSNFANEMLASYATLRYIEHVRGPWAARSERRRMVSNVARVASERGLVALDEIQGWGAGVDSRVYTACAYDKGAMLLHALEFEMGREDFDAALGRFFEQHRGRVVEYADLRESLGASRYKRLFEQWGRAELPGFEVEFAVRPSGANFKVSGTVHQAFEGKPFDLTLTLRAVAGERTQDHLVRVKQGETPFSFPCEFPPEELRLDPEYDWVRVLPVVADLDALRETIFRVANSPKIGDPASLRGTISKVERVFAAGAALDPGLESAFHTALGRCHFRLGEFEPARREFALALEGGAGGPFHRAWIRLRLGCIADLEGDREVATASYESVLASKGNGTQKQYARRFLKSPYRGYSSDG
jgi:aminopeptidase N